jgi:hypothetical protein
MTPALLEKIAGLIKAGATSCWPSPPKSPSLVGYPKSTGKIASKMVETVWGPWDGTAQQVAPPMARVGLFGEVLNSRLDHLYPNMM